MRKQFVKTVKRLVEHDDRIVIFLGDISVYAFRNVFREFPSRIYNIGICEQSMASMAAGLSKEGLIPIIHSIAPFVVDRCFEQLKCDVCYQKLPVNIVSVGASYDYAGLGCTHHCPGDIATLKTLPGMEIIVPGTPEEFDLLFSETYSNDHPTYYRLSENSNSINFPVKFGYANVIQSGSLATVLAVGPALRFVLKAVEDLDVTLIYYTTVEPFDIGTLLNNSISNKYIIIEPYYSSGLSAEIHNAFGNNPLTIKNIAVPKIFLTNYGRSEDHDEKLGFNIENIRFTINSFINE